MLSVYGRATSSNVQALLWGLEELGLEYERLEYGGLPGSLDGAEFRALNPHGKIPVLLVEGTPIWETGAILRYLASEHADDGFWPKDPLRRAQVDMWAEWAKHSVAAGFTGPVFWRHTRTRPERRDAALIAQGIANLEAELGLAEAALTRQRFICGAALTLADIQLGHVLYRYFDIDIERADLPALRAYYGRLCGRAAFQQTIMVSYQSLRNTF